MGKRGPSKEPAEKQRKKGNPGKRPLPDLADVVALAPASNRTPQRPLGPAGQAAWNETWEEAGDWIANSDRGVLQLYAEAVDDYSLLRARLLDTLQQNANDPTIWRIRKQVFDARNQVRQLATDLGLSPSARAVLGVAEVRISQALNSILERQPVAAVRTLTIE